MPASFASFEDVQNAYEGTIGMDRRNWVEGRIVRAQRLLANKVGDLNQFDHQLVSDTIADAVARFVRNPRGLQQENDGDYGYRLDPSASVGNLGFTADELALFGRGGGQRIGTIRVGLMSREVRYS